MKNTRHLGRRQFLKTATAAAAMSYVSGLLPRRMRAASSREKLFLFRYSDVKLTGGPLKSQFDRIHAAYLALNEDQILKVYRQRAGLPAPGPDAGGWYDAEAFAPGHGLGQYISGLARFADATDDSATQAKVKRLVDGFAATIAPDGYCYASEKASTSFPAYMFDKHMIGLLDAHQFAGVSSALDVLERATRGAVKYLPPRAIDRNLEPLKQSPYDETYTLGENFFYAYEVTGDSQYLDLAKRFLLNKTYFEPLARGENVLPGRHAYSHCNALSSAARAYLVVGEPQYLDTIRNAWEMIVKTQQFASGGWGPGEAFVEPGKGLLGESLDTTHAHFETPCGAYAHFKLARYLLRFTGDARYGDGLERVLYNTVLGAKDPSGDGYFFYYSDYHPAGHKVYFPDKFPCCSGTLPQAVADYVVSAYFRGADGIYVNLYAPSELSFKLGDASGKLIQSTDYPESDSAELRLELPAPSEFAVYLRIPSWLKSQPRIEINGKDAGVNAEPGAFAALRRRWQNQDTIAVKLPFSLRTEPVDDQHPRTAALMNGPLMLVALEPQFKLPAGATSLPQQIKPVSHLPQTFELQAPLDKLRFAPFYAVKEEAYTSYLTQA